MYKTQELQQLHRAGKAHKLPTGRIIPTSNPLEIATAITEAKTADGTGSTEDDAGLRSHLVSRAAAHDMTSIVPSTWSAQAGKSQAADYYEAMARRVSDPAAREHYQELAKGARKLAAPAEVTLSGSDREHDRRLVLRDGGQRVTLDAPGGIRWMQEDRAADGSTEVGRAFAKSQRLTDMAERVADPVAQQHYRTLAKAAREEAGII